MPELESRILDHVNQPNYQPVKPRVIAKKLGIAADNLADFKRVLKRLVKQGRLAYGASHLVLPVAVGHAARDNDSPNTNTESLNLKSQISNLKSQITQLDSQPAVLDGSRKPTAPSAPRSTPNHVTGVFRRAQAGFGFVRPADSAPQADRKLDIFIPADRTLDAASGDTVLVKLQRHRDVRRPNPVGEIVEVLERETHQFVGTYFEAGGNAFAQVDGTLFVRPILLGDPGAKNAQPDDKIVFEMVRFPTHYRDGEGVIVEVLGARGDPGVDTLSIIREFNLPEAFPDDVLDDSRKQAERFDESIAG